MQKLVDQSQQLERLFRRITEATFVCMIDLHIELHAMTIEERHKKFHRKNPRLLQLEAHSGI